MQTQAGKVADQDVPGQIAFLEAREIVGGLLEGAVEVLAARFVLDQQDAFPQQIDETALAVGLLHQFLETGDASAGDAEDVEETVPECLRFGILGRLVGPFAREFQRAVPDFVPAQRHVSSPFFDIGEHTESRRQRQAP